MNIRLILHLCLISVSVNAFSQTSISDFLEKNGFYSQSDNIYINVHNDTLRVSDNYVIGFSSVQTHKWFLILGDGKNLGATLTINVGDTLIFDDGTLQLQDKSLISFDCPKLRRGIVKSPIFNTARESVSITDIKTETDAVKFIGMYSPANGIPHKLDLFGNFDDVKRKKEAKDKQLITQIEEENEVLKTERLVKRYANLCKQYGKEKIDKVLNGGFASGVPIDLIFEYQNFLTTYKTISEHGSIATIRFTPIMYPTQGFFNIWDVTYNTKNKIVQSYQTIKTKASWL